MRTTTRQITIFWRYGLGIHLGLVIVIGASAYLGILPTTYAAIPHFDLFAHAVLIGLLAFFLDGALEFRRVLTGMPFLGIAPLIVLLLAAIEELVHNFVKSYT